MTDETDTKKTITLPNYATKSETISKREFFAIKVLQSIVAKETFVYNAELYNPDLGTYTVLDKNIREAYAYADAMIKEGEQ